MNLYLKLCALTCARSCWSCMSSPFIKMLSMCSNLFHFQLIMMNVQFVFFTHVGRKKKLWKIIEKNHLWTSEPLIQELQLYHQINFKFWVLWTQAEINKPFINWRWHGTCCLLGHHTKKRRSTETCDFKINVRCIEHLDVILNIWYYDLQVLELPLTACQFQSLCFSFLKFK